MARGFRRRGLIVAFAWAAMLLIGLAAIGSAAGPPFPSPQASHYVYDTAGVFSQTLRKQITNNMSDLHDRTGAQVVVYTQVKAASTTSSAVQTDANGLVRQWGLDDGAVMFWDFTKDQSQAIVVFAAGPTFISTRASQAAMDDIVTTIIADNLHAKNWFGALIQGTTYLSATISAATVATPPPPPGTAAPSGAPSSTPKPGATPAPSTVPTVPSGPTPPAGPPYPAPVNGVSVYDYANVLRASTIASVSQTIAGIRDRTGAEVVVYTQVKPQSSTFDLAQADAIALINQWGVGRKGINDGLAILFDMDQSKCHGQVQLYGADGYRATYLSNAEREAVFNNDMLPYLRSCDLDDALLVAMRKVDANATPDHARALEQARQVDAVMGLIAAPLAFLGLVGWAGWSWVRFGRDPVYLDDPSIMMPAPPPGLTPGASALMIDGHGSRHTLTTAMVDLASRGEIAFQQDEGLLHTKVGIQITSPDPRNAQVQLNRRTPTDPAEDYALEQLTSIADRHGGYVDPDNLLEFGKHVDSFDKKLDTYVATRGWFREPPEKSIERWSFRGGIALVLGFVVLIIGFNLPSGGVEVFGGALLVGGTAVFVISRSMPQRTMAGAMAYAMLAAYRRTLQKTLEQARSMNDVVDSKAIPWLETPDQAVVWGVAFGLNDQVEEVLQRSMEDVQQGQISRTPYFPIWYGAHSGFGGGGGIAPGLFSGSAIPDFGGMMSALGTIGNSPASSGGSGGGGGGGFGGGSTGGGGGAGGGF